MPINVLIVDDDELIRSSLKIILDMDSGIHVAGTCHNGDEAFRKVGSSQRKHACTPGRGGQAFAHASER